MDNKNTCCSCARLSRKQSESTNEVVQEKNEKEMVIDLLQTAWDEIREARINIDMVLMKQEKVIANKISDLKYGKPQRGSKEQEGQTKKCFAARESKNNNKSKW